jgi:hypothetical protein
LNGGIAGRLPHVCRGIDKSLFSLNLPKDFGNRLISVGHVCDNKTGRMHDNVEDKDFFRLNGCAMSSVGNTQEVWWCYSVDGTRLQWHLLTWI